MSKYNPKAYWERRGGRYTSQHVRGELDTLARWVEAYQPWNILEVGCGYGRVYQHLRQSYKGPITLCDFVYSFRRRCEVATGILPDWWDGHTLPYDDDSFDLVISCAVLNHVPAEDLEQVFSEHVRVMSKWMYVAVGIPKVSRGPNIWHDYPPLFKRHGLVVLRSKKPKVTRANWWLKK